ncbi:Zinc finger Ran-binding domain-containing protein [Actinidia chinensis var. chinensis]|uniref:Zinc finger Ran-binding domain-containing protein n=1 Tax=Actinidia chinensis var. chinensis TaxID=1590841 RepID=A0A2R6PM69_ACTCC|nr:Zinc finger Ran-binding domain-containing protein [Actinidia chinensis var. chinensis]
MRTRFLSIDYFNSAPNQALETVEFLRFPPPHLPPSNPSIFEDLSCFFDDVSSQSLSLEIESFPIDSALSKFFYNVLPRSIDVETVEFAESEEDRFDKQRNSSSRYAEEKNEFFNGKEACAFGLVEFELPELDPSLENACFFEEEKIQFFSEVVESDINMDMLTPVLTLCHPFEVLESIYSVDDITPAYTMEQKPILLEDPGAAPDQGDLHNSTFPLLEVDDITLGIFSGISMEEEFLLLEYIEPQACPQRGLVIGDGKELLGSLNVDILEYISDHCLSNQCFEALPSCSNFSFEMDLISIIELSYNEGNSAFQREIPVDNANWAVIPVNFEEIQFLEFDYYQFLDVFSNSLTICEAVPCEQMFAEGSNLMNFNELLVSHELILVDESFKSLPTPILSDHEETRSQFLFFEEMLAALKPQHTSASDGIYLDWHLLEEEYSTRDKYSSCLKQVLEINDYCISDLESLNDGIPTFDFVFIGDSDTPNGAKVKDDKETLDVLPGGIPTVSACLNDFASSKLLNDGCEKHGNGESITDIRAERVSSLAESISPFNDLNFFLNPREASAGRSSKPAVKAFDGNAVFPAVSSTNQIAPRSTTSVQLQQCNLVLHQVKLSDNILELVDNLQKNYLAILKSDMDLIKAQRSSLAMDDTKLLSLPKEELMDCIKKTNAQGTSLAHQDDNTVALATLCAIKQMAWYLCYYGIHTTYLYANKLCRTLECLKYRLSFLQRMIEDMHGKAERDVTAIHPSISVIQAILQSNVNDRSLKGCSLQIYYSQFLLIKKLEELLNFVPREEKYDLGSSRAGDEAEVEAFCMPVPVPCVTSAVEPEQIPISVASFPAAVIIVNTQNFDKEMIISRRSTYQRILAMEKQGAQVVERDLKLPVDVIISAATCLVWYDCRNIGKKATAPDEASSCLPLCIENIAANVLTSLSFSFSCCILVFEGESSFLAAVMESSDELYAAAASLSIDLQLFCSHSSELTDEIILSCIGCATKLTRHNYPKMPESETLAESFLTAFPSINPLSAHAILSSGGILVELLQWSHQHRLRAIQKYHVPDQSVSLLSTLCCYGEREVSRSAMTDCSSSVSSAPDSENCHYKTGSLRKKGKYSGSPPKIDTPVDNLFHFELSKQFPDGSLNFPQASMQHDSWMSGCEEIFDEFEKLDVSVSDKWFSQKQGSGPSGVAAMMNPSKACKQLDSRTSRETEMSNEFKRPGWPLDDKLFGPLESLDMAPLNKVDYHFNNNFANLQKDLIGEVIDIGDSFSAGENFSTIANSLNLSPSVPETDKDPAVRNFRTARKLSFSSSSLPIFPPAAEISYDSNIRFSTKDYGQSLTEGNDRDTDAEFTRYKLPLKYQEKLLEDGSVQKNALPFQKKDRQQRGGTALSKAIHSVHPQEGSPWTIEFLNRIREKSRLRQQSLPHDMSPRPFSYSGNISKNTKRKSPSTLDFYKYQGGSTRKIIEQRRKKRSTQPSNLSRNEKTSASFCLSTWTPPDKRARRTLSFSTGGDGGQSKLVWSDKDAQSMDRRFYHRPGNSRKDSHNISPISSVSFSLSSTKATFTYWFREHGLPLEYVLLD